jgi:hypothetical protein
MAISLLRPETLSKLRAVQPLCLLCSALLLVFRAAGTNPAAVKRQSRLLTMGERIYRVYTSISSNKGMRHGDKQMATASINEEQVRRLSWQVMAHWLFTLLGFVRSVFCSREVANSVDRSYSSQMRSRKDKHGRTLPQPSDSCKS